MLNIGLIGKIGSIDKMIQVLNKYNGIRILGKSSVGIKEQSSDYEYSVPEYNKIELLERSDAILLEDSDLLPYEFFKDSIKRDKHFFFTEYPKFNLLQLNELSKLIDEAGTVVQIKNPLFNLSSIQWLKGKFTMPVYFEINKKIIEPCILPDDLNNLFMLATTRIGREVKRLKNSFIKGKDGDFQFQNIRLEFDDSSIFNMNILSSQAEEFKLKVISKQNIYQINILKNTIEDLSGNIGLKKFKAPDMYESFFRAIKEKEISASGINEFISVFKLTGEIESLMHG